jgi:PadR family transcriptional regulator, regulatory protein PadR
MQGKELDQEEGLQENEQTDDLNIKNMKRHDRKMIRGFMRGFGKIIILWLISKNRQHGYEIMTQLHEASPFSSKMPSTSMIYPVLHGLERKGLIKGSWEHHGKRKVKYYEITKEGEESLERIRNLVSKGHELGKANLYQEFMEDMFSLNNPVNKMR